MSQTLCSQCNSPCNKVKDRPDKYRVILRCDYCGHTWMMDDTPHGMYGELNTKRGLVGRPLKGLRLDKVKNLSVHDKQILSNLS